jgi:hypothetical protein
VKYVNIKINEDKYRAGIHHPEANDDILVKLVVGVQTEDC